MLKCEQLNSLENVYESVSKFMEVPGESIDLREA